MKRIWNVKHLAAWLVLALLLLQGCGMHGPTPLDETASHMVRPGETSYNAAAVMNTDSDKDGVSDAWDRCPDTPEQLSVNNEGCPLPQDNPVLVHFGLNSEAPLPRYQGELQRVAVLLEANPNLGVLVEGHTDALGPRNVNQHLSEQRAASVARMLSQEYGVDPARVRSRGKGEDLPIGDNATPEGRLMNRRVELVVVDLNHAALLARQRQTEDTLHAEATAAPQAAPASAHVSSSEENVLPASTQDAYQAWTDPTALGSLMLAPHNGSEDAGRAEATVPASHLAGSLMLSMVPEPEAEATPMADANENARLDRPVSNGPAHELVIVLADRERVALSSMESRTHTVVFEPGTFFMHMDNTHGVQEPAL